MARNLHKSEEKFWCLESRLKDGQLWQDRNHTQFETKSPSKLLEQTHQILGLNKHITESGGGVCALPFSKGTQTALFKRKRYARTINQVLD